MIIDENSPLRRRPSINPEQTLFLDGICYSIEMADLAYCRLRNTLNSMSINCVNRLPSKHIYSVSAILDAWSIIDSLDRLRGFLHCAEFVKKDLLPVNDPLTQHFNTVRLLRNSIQHIPQNVNKLIGNNKNHTILGSLSWFIFTDFKKMEGMCCTFTAGTAIQNTKIPMLNPAGKNIESPLDLITLSTSKYSICFSELMKYIKLMAIDIEKQICQQTLGLPKAAADITICLHMRFTDEQKRIDNP